MVLVIYIGGGVPWHTQKGGGVLGAGTSQKGGLRCGLSPQKGGLRFGHNQMKVKHAYNPKKGDFFGI